jgi:outer membrane protein insertion porin family
LKLRYYSLIAFFTIILLQGCNVTRNLTDDQYLLVGQKIKGNEEVKTSELEALYRQTANRRVLGTMPYLFFYNIGASFHDSARIAERMEETRQKYNRRIDNAPVNSNKAIRLDRRKDKKINNLRQKMEEGNWLMRIVGEPPVIFDSTLASTSAEQMQLYIFNEGFFTNSVHYTADTSGKLISTTYHVKEHKPHNFRQIVYVTSDTTIKRLLNESMSEALIDIGQRYQEENLTLERERIDRMLRNNGYYSFSREYITYQADTAATDSLLGNRLIDLRVIISDPVKGKHQQYRFGETYFTLDADPTGAGGVRDTMVYDGVHYMSFTTNHPFATLDRKLQFEPGKLYNQSDIINTQAQLGGMDMFRFVNLTFDTINNKVITNIYTSRLPKYQITDEVGILVTQGAPGPFVNLTFKVRNALRGYEIFELSGRYSEEGQLSPLLNPGTIYRARELGINASLLFPELLLPGRLKVPFARFNPKTRLVAGFTDINRPEYRRSILRTSLTYLLQLGNTQTLSISPIDLNLINTLRLDSTFRQTLLRIDSSGNPLIQSFNKSIVSSLTAAYVINTSQSAALQPTQNSFFFRAGGEFGGLTPSLVSDAFYEGNDKVGDLQIFQYIKTDLDFRYYSPFNRVTTLATRIRTGIALPVLRTAKGTLPYEKFFFLGGGNSMRAWPVRRLGPGSYTPINPETGQLDYRQEQPGEIMLEANVELRRKLIGFLEGAVFIDAGNIWSARDSTSRPGASFESDFWKEIAVGTGLGLRFDFSFLIVRFDFGIRAIDPAQPAGKRFVLDEFSYKAPFSDRVPFPATLQIGIGYPF